MRRRVKNVSSRRAATNYKRRKTRRTFLCLPPSGRGIPPSFRPPFPQKRRKRDAPRRPASAKTGCGGGDHLFHHLTAVTIASREARTFTQMFASWFNLILINFAFSNLSEDFLFVVHPTPDKFQIRVLVVFGSACPSLLPCLLYPRPCTRPQHSQHDERGRQ